MVRESFLPPEDNRKTIAGLPPAAENEAVKARAFELLKKIRSVALATVTNDKPAVRIVSVSAIRDDRIFFLAPRGKPLYHQIRATPYVALCGMTPDEIVVRAVNEPRSAGENKATILRH